MLKLSLIALFVVSLATLTMAASALPVPGVDGVSPKAALVAEASIN